MSKLYGSATKMGKFNTAYDIDTYIDRPQIFISAHQNASPLSSTTTVILTVEDAVTFKLHLANAIRSAKRLIRDNKTR